MRGFISNAKSKRAASVFDEHHDCAKALGEKHEPPFCNVMGRFRGQRARRSQRPVEAAQSDEWYSNGPG